jgi:hypothetical protein
MMDIRKGTAMNARQERSLAILRKGAIARAIAKLEAEERDGERITDLAYCIVWELERDDCRKIITNARFAVASEALSAAALACDNFGYGWRVVSARICHVSDLAIGEIDAIG